jgi:hypothetical protein
VAGCCESGNEISGFTKYEKFLAVAFEEGFCSKHLVSHTIIVPTKCTSLLKAQDITICTFLSLYS